MTGNSIKTTFGFLLLLTLATVVSEAEDHTVRIRVVNAKTGEPMTAEGLTVMLGEDSKLSVGTDATGVARVDAGKVRTLRVVANQGEDCRENGEAARGYSVATIRHTGIKAGNTCGHAHNPAAPGELVLFEIPKLAPVPTVKIRVINARTNKPVTDESLNVALRTDQVGSVAMPTDKRGIIEVEPGSASILRVQSNMYADCRPRSEIYTNYPLATIQRDGITTGNLCSGAQPRPVPGELILFEIPKKYVPVYPAPPANSMPHSDEGPSSQ